MATRAILLVLCHLTQSIADLLPGMRQKNLEGDVGVVGGAWCAEGMGWCSVGWRQVGFAGPGVRR